MANNYDRVQKGGVRKDLEIGRNLEKHLSLAPSVGYSLLVPSKSLARQQTIGAGGAHFPTIAEMSKSSQPGSLSFTEWSDYNRLMDRRCYQGLISLLDASQKEFLDIVDTLARIKDPLEGQLSYVSDDQSLPNLSGGPASKSLGWGFRASVNVAKPPVASTTGRSSSPLPPASPQQQPKSPLLTSKSAARRVQIAASPESDRGREGSPPHSPRSATKSPRAGSPGKRASRPISRGVSFMPDDDEGELTATELAQEKAFARKASEVMPLGFGPTGGGPKTPRDWQKMLKRMSTLNSTALEDVLGQEEKELVSIHEGNTTLRLAKKAPHREKAPVLEDFNEMIERIQAKQRDLVSKIKSGGKAAGGVEGTASNLTKKKKSTGPPAPVQIAPDPYALDKKGEVITLAHHSFKSHKAAQAAMEILKNVKSRAASPTGTAGGGHSPRGGGSPKAHHVQRPVLPTAPVRPGWVPLQRMKSHWGPFDHKTVLEEEKLSTRAPFVSASHVTAPKRRHTPPRGQKIDRDLTAKPVLSATLDPSTLASELNATAPGTGRGSFRTRSSGGGVSASMDATGNYACPWYVPSRMRGTTMDQHLSDRYREDRVRAEVRKLEADLAKARVEAKQSYALGAMRAKVMGQPWPPPLSPTAADRAQTAAAALAAGEDAAGNNRTASRAGRKTAPSGPQQRTTHNGGRASAKTGGGSTARTSRLNETWGVEDEDDEDASGREGDSFVGSMVGSRMMTPTLGGGRMSHPGGGSVRQSRTSATYEMASNRGGSAVPASRTSQTGHASSLLDAVNAAAKARGGLRVSVSPGPA